MPDYVPATTGKSCQKKKVPFSQMYISLLAFLEWLLSQSFFLLFIGQVIVGLRWSQQVSLVANGPKLGGLFLGERPLSHPNLHTLIIIQVT